MTILVLGHNGMLGHIVSRYLETLGHKIITTDYRYPSTEFKQAVLSFDGDYVVNAIGAIPQKTQDFSINYTLPIWLADHTKCKMVHAATDCEVDLDDYGTSKRIANAYIKQYAKNTKIIKTSIIGPELNSSYSLLDWFLNADKEVQGYTDALWNGVTTLEWAKHCHNLMNNWKASPTEITLSSKCISKFELLCIIQEVFNKKITILARSGLGKNKCLLPTRTTLDIKTQLIELKDFYYK